MKNKVIIENFDQFMQQASIAQLGDPKVFGSNPKKKTVKFKRRKLRIKPKSEQQPA